MKRFIDNRILAACIRPQLPKWCGPTTVSEVLKVLLNKCCCPHEVAKSMGWTDETLIKGMGTKAVLDAVIKMSNHRLSYQIIKIKNSEDLWTSVIDGMKRKEVLYLHEKGHHVLILGYIEEPNFSFEDFEKGVDCKHSLPFKLHLTPSLHSDLANKIRPPSTSSTNLTTVKRKRYILKAEHNFKPCVYTQLIVERELETLATELIENKDRLHLARIFTK